jgi:hypothetical protein
MDALTTVKVVARVFGSIFLLVTSLGAIVVGIIGWPISLGNPVLFLTLCFLVSSYLTHQWWQDYSGYHVLGDSGYDETFAIWRSYGEEEEDLAELMDDSNLSDAFEDT